MANGPEGDEQAEPTRPEGDEVRGPVAVDAVEARALAVGLDDAVTVEDEAVEDVEHVAGEDGRQRHEAPVLAEAVDAKGLSDDGREDAEEEAVAQPGEPGDEPEEVRARDVERADLRDAEDQAGNDEAPHTACVQNLDQEVGSNAW